MSQITKKPSSAATTVPTVAADDVAHITVAMIGSRGFPGQRAGVERVLESVCPRLVASGRMSVRVHCAADLDYPSDDFEGVELVRTGGLRTKYADTYTRSLLATLKELRSDSDIVHYHGIGSAPFALLVRLFRKRVTLTVHALDWQRSKWGRFARWYLRFGEWASMKFPHETVAVSKVLQDDLEKRYRKPVAFISNGAEPRAFAEVDEIAQFDLEPRKFLLFVGRLVPEKGVHLLVEAFRRLPETTDLKLAIAGPRWFEPDYDAELQELSAGDDRIVFLGEADDARLAELYSNCAAFVLPSDVEGMSLSMLDAMAFGAAIITSSIPPNATLIGDAGVVFEAGNIDSLHKAIVDVVSSDERAHDLRCRSHHRVGEEFDWDHIANEWIEFYDRLRQR